MQAVAGSEADEWIPPNAKVPITAFLRLDDPRSALDRAQFRGTLELYDADEVPLVTVVGRMVPLSFEPSATLAYRLEGAPIWDFEIAGFRKPTCRSSALNKTHGLGMLYPYRPGRIPVVFVHGTASSPARWAEMANDLLGDPRSRAATSSGSSSTTAAIRSSRLGGAAPRRAETAVADVDPEGKDPALRQMVMIGHSQGGLLTKLMVVNSGNAFWDASHRGAVRAGPSAR